MYGKSTRLNSSPHRATISDLTSATHDNNTKRSVKFGQSVAVVLIPTRDEYKEADLVKNMWWDSSDLHDFKASSETELRRVMRGCRVNLSHARTMLYQPISMIVNDLKRNQ